MAKNGTPTRYGEPPVDRLLERLRKRGGLRSVLRSAGPELGRLFKSTDAILVVSDIAGRHGFLWRCSQDPHAESSVGYTELPAENIGQYLRGPTGDWFLWQSGVSDKSGRWQLRRPKHDYVLDADTDLVEHARFLVGSRPLLSLASIEIPPLGDWFGRFFVINASAEHDGDLLGELATLARALGPTMLLKHDQRQLRARTRAEERASLARELHDGVIQSLLCLRMRVHVLARDRAHEPLPELSALERELQQQVIALRELTENLRAPDLDPPQLVNLLRAAVEQFQGEAGIAATFSAHMDEVLIDSTTCREIIRLVQEALINVKRHSGATCARVRFEGDDQEWLIEIADDGRGFPFSGRLTLEDMDRTLQGPRVIKERVRTLGGDLIIESNQWHGARLEIRIPVTRDGFA